MATMMRTKPTRIVVIGSGAVGATTAYTLLLRDRANEIVLIDANREKAHGDALDMSHGSPFIGGVKVFAGTYEDCAAADIVIITAGAAQRPGESRQDLVKRNIVIMRDIISGVLRYNPDPILLVATNPVDVLTYAAWKLSGLSHRRVIGSGTVLDSARFRYLIGEKAGVTPRSVHGYVIGEHGDSELPAWSKTNIVGTPIVLTSEEKEEVFSATRNAAYQIIQAKGSTSYAIALSLDRICAAILNDESAILNVSSYIEEYHGIHDVYLGFPTILTREGVRDIIDLQLDEQEFEALHRSATYLKDRIAELQL